MSSEGILVVYCPRCNKPHKVSADDKKFFCEECRVEYSIARPPGLGDALEALSDIKAQIDSIGEQVQEPGILPEESIQRKLEHLSERLGPLEELLSRARPPTGLVKVSREDRYLVPLNQVHVLNEADVESGVIFGLFNLFLGLLSQQLMSGVQPISTAIALALPTVAFAGWTVYAWRKAQRRKTEIEKKAKETAIPVSMVLLEE